MVGVGGGSSNERTTRLIERAGVRRRVRGRTILALALVLLAGCVSGPAPRSNARAPTRGDATGWPPIEQATVRPGGKLYDFESSQNTCTLGFVFASADNASLFVSTDSHCLTGLAVGAEIAIG